MYAIKTEIRPVEAQQVFNSVQDLLSAWARWRWSGHGANVGYPSEAPFRKHMRMPGSATVAALPIEDDLALSVDKAVSQLKMRSELIEGDHRWLVLTDSYLNGWVDSTIARRRKISRSTVRTARLAAENWIEGRVY